MTVASLTDPGDELAGIVKSKGWPSLFKSFSSSHFEVTKAIVLLVKNDKISVKMSLRIEQSCTGYYGTASRSAEIK